MPGQKGRQRWSRAQHLADSHDQAGPAAAGEHDFRNHRIEGPGSELQDTVRRLYVKALKLPRCQVPEAVVFHLNNFWLASRGARCRHQIREAPRRHRGVRSSGAVSCHGCPFGVQTQHLRWTGKESQTLHQVRLRHQHVWPCLLEERRQLFLRVGWGRIQEEKRSSCLEHRPHTDEHLKGTSAIHRDPNDDFWSDPVFLESMRQLVGPFIEFPIGQLLFPKNRCNCVGVMFSNS